MALTVHRGEILHFRDDPGDTAPDHPDPPWAHFQDGALVVEDGHIAACGAAAEVMARLPDGTDIVHHPRCLIVPGMVDTHTHYPQCEITAAYGTQLLEWLTQYTFPAEAKFHDRQYANDISARFLDELLRHGTTTALVFGTVHPQSVEAFFDAAHARNLRMICGKVMMDRNAPPDLCDTAEGGAADSAALIRRWHGRGRLGYAVTPRFAPTSTARQLALAGQLLTRHRGVHLHTHLAENRRECEWVAELFPDCRDYVDVYARHGLLTPRSVFAHAIHLSPDQWQRLGDARANVAFCPTSNLFIGSGLFDLESADRYGVRTGLGTDIGGGDSFSLLRTVNEAYKVQQLRGANLPPLRALYLATLGGARALDMDTHIGNFETGKEADFITLDYHATPFMAFRLQACKTLAERLFVLLMLGDDRAIGEVWVMGQRWSAPSV